MVTSALYEGTVFHDRRGPVAHRFTQSLALPLLDVERLDDVFAQHPLWSVETRNAVTFRRRDFFGDPAVSLAETVRARVEEETAYRPTGPVLLLAHLRTWGWLFNPIAIHFCLAADGSAVEAAVLEVTNTPWHERHTYVVGPGTTTFAKDLHVSPFLAMTHDYRLELGELGPRLRVRLDVLAGDHTVLATGFDLVRRPLDRRAMSRLLWRHVFMTARVSGGIYRQALRLRRKGAVVHRHPPPRVRVGAE